MKWIPMLAVPLLLLAVELGAQEIREGAIREVWPGESIQDAIDDSEPGDLVRVHPGAYNEAIVLKSGVDVRSTDGSDLTIINAGAQADAAVDASNRSDLDLGGVGAGFTVNGGVLFGLRLDNCQNISARDIQVETQAAWSGILCSQCDQSVHLQDIYVDVQWTSPALGGVYLGDCDLLWEGGDVSYSTAEGIWVESQVSAPTVLDVDIQDCNTGLFVVNGAVYYRGSIRDCSTGIRGSAPSWSSFLSVDGAQFWGCTTGVRTGADGGHSVLVWIDNCKFEGSGGGVDGIVLDYAKGHVNASLFHDLAGDGITVTNLMGDLQIADGNFFQVIDGTGIELGAAALGNKKVTIHDNTFWRVYGTGILCQTGSLPYPAEIEIQNCNFDGIESFEAIHTEIVGTMAEIRDCTFENYDLAGFPVPRAVYVRQHTADLGHDIPGDWGNNRFENTGFDVYYSGISAGPPPVLYAEQNWWGEVPPDPSQFVGNWRDYIDYDPYLTRGPGGTPPAVEGAPFAPKELVLNDICPNPAVGTARVSCGVPVAGHVELALWDLQGRRVRTLIEGALPAGTSNVEWDATDDAGNAVASGVYLCGLRCAAGGAVRRFVFMR